MAGDRDTAETKITEPMCFMTRLQPKFTRNSYLATRTFISTPAVPDFTYHLFSFFVFTYYQL